MDVNCSGKAVSIQFIGIRETAVVQQSPDTEKSRTNSPSKFVKIWASLESNKNFEAAITFSRQSSRNKMFCNYTGDSHFLRRRQAKSQRL